MQVITRQEAINKIKEISEIYRVNTVQYSEIDFPNGATTENDIITVKSFEQIAIGEDSAYIKLSYKPWIRVMTSDLSIDEYTDVLSQGNNVLCFLEEVNDYLNQVQIKAID